MLLIVQDPYTSYYDAKVVCDFVALTQKLGYRPVLLPFKPNGKAQHIKGFLRQFSHTARTQAEFLNRMAKLELPLVGVDPAIVRNILGSTGKHAAQPDGRPNPLFGRIVAQDQEFR